MHPQRPGDQDQPGTVFWAGPPETVLQSLGTTSSGLSSSEALSRARSGRPRDSMFRNPHSDFRLLARQFRGPIILLLLAAALLSTVLRDTVDAAIILGIVAASGLLGFVQERGAVRAVNALLAQVRLRSDVLRDGRTVAVLHDAIVPGDVLSLRAGDIIPADCRLLSSTALRVDESALTGEPYAAEKEPGNLPIATPLSSRANALFAGTHVVSGDGIAVAVTTGPQTELGSITSHLRTQHVPTSFERGVTAFGYLLIRATLVLVAGVFSVNIALGRPWLESILFSLALAVGLTPQMLPAIVTLSLAFGARAMARARVIVKRLDAIEDIGEIDVLCTDKTGTLTAGVIQLDAALDANGEPDSRVARLARVNARCQRGFANPLDTAILEATGGAAPAADSGLPAEALAEVPYDFTRRRLSVLADLPDGRFLITKGAYEPVAACCAAVASPSGPVIPLAETRAALDQRFEQLSAQGFRVLGVAYRAMPGAATATEADEAGLTFAGFLAFADPPKPGAREAIEAFRAQGIAVHIITGDNRFAAAHLAAVIGLHQQQTLTGTVVAGLSDAELAARVTGAGIFAEIDPIQKERIVRAFRAAGHAVGFLGDGINDAPALHVADVGISVDGAADVAKQSADLVLLEKDLAILERGIREGRRVFANTMKYAFVTTSANFGNMLSMAAAAAFLPFLPLLPRQILLLNFLSDIPGMSIARDRVDAEQVSGPRAWSIRNVRDFMLLFGLVSSAFDILTFAALRLVLEAGPALFRTAWFVESTLTELAVMLTLRTPRPFLRSRPGTVLVVSSAAVCAITVALPFSPAAGAIGMAPLPAGFVATLAIITVSYVAATETIKRRFGARFY